MLPMRSPPVPAVANKLGTSTTDAAERSVNVERDTLIELSNTAVTAAPVNTTSCTTVLSAPVNFSTNSERVGTSQGPPLFAVPKFPPSVPGINSWRLQSANRSTLANKTLLAAMAGVEQDRPGPGAEDAPEVVDDELRGAPSGNLRADTSHKETSRSPPDKSSGGENKRGKKKTVSSSQGPSKDGGPQAGSSRPTTRSVMSRTGRVYNKETKKFETPKEQNSAHRSRSSVTWSDQGDSPSFQERLSRISRIEGDPPELVTDSSDEEVEVQTVRKAKRTAKKTPTSKSTKTTKGQKRTEASPRRGKGNAKGKSKTNPKKGKNAAPTTVTARGNSPSPVTAEKELEYKDILTKGENSYINLRKRVKEFVTHIQTSYEPPLHVEQAKQLREIRGELMSLIKRHCLNRGQKLVEQGEEVGVVLVSGYEEFRKQLVEAEHVLEVLERDPHAGSSSERGEVSSGSGSPCTPTPKRAKRKKGSSSKKKRLISWLESLMESDENQGRKKPRHSTPKKTNKDYQRFLNKLRQGGSLFSSRHSDRTRDSVTLEESRRSRRRGSPPSSPSSSSSSSSESSSSPSSCSTDSSEDSDDSDSSSELRSFLGSPVGGAHRSRRRKKRSKKSKKKDKRKSKKRGQGSRRKQRAAHPLKDILGCQAPPKGYVPTYLGPGGEGKRFYRDLPTPWNIRPSHMPVSFGQVSMLYRSGVVPKFAGNVGSYASFRSQFILAVHSLDLSILAKHLFLKASLKDVGDLQPLLQSVPTGSQGYRLLVARLEDKYGGIERLLGHHLSQLKNVPLVHPGDLGAAEALYDAVQSYKAALRQAGSYESTTHSYFSFVKAKLSHSLRLKYRDYCSYKGSKNCQSVNALLKWLRRGVIRPLQMEPAPPRRPAPARVGGGKGDAGPPRGPEMNPEGFKKLKEMAQGEGKLFAASAATCPGCLGNHTLAECPAFKKLPAPERRDYAYKLRVCFKCLIPGHFNSNCSAPPCSKCGKPHHVLTHGPSKEFGKDRPAAKPASKPSGDSRDKGSRPAEPPVAGARPPPPPGHAMLTEGEANSLQTAIRLAQQGLPEDVIPEAGEELSFMYRCMQAGVSDVVSLRFLPVQVTNCDNGKTQYVGALIDDGSNMTCGSEKLADWLQCPQEKYPFSVVGINGKVVNHNTRLMRLGISNKAGTVRKNLVARTLPDPAGGLKMTDWKRYLHLWPHLKDIQLPELPDNLSVELIIGNDQPYFHRALQEVYGDSPNHPVARRSPLGWTVTGPVFPSGYKDPATGAKTSLYTRVLEAGPKAYWAEPEECMKLGPRPRPPVLQGEDRDALRGLYDSLTRLPSGHFEAGVMWKDATRPPNNKYPALQEWLRQEKSLSKVPDRRKAYDKVVRGWIESGYVQKLSDSAYDDKDAFYLVHFPVYREDKSSTKVRVVMNGKAQFQGKSLNDCIVKGPKLLNGLVDVLVRFRRFRIALSGDVKEMFLQVAMPEDDQRYHRFFYTLLGEDYPSILQALVHQFGNRGSPVTVIFVIKWAAWCHIHKYPLAAETVLDSSLVDDCLDSVRSTEEGQELVAGLIAIFASCG